jgi:hypothetical protein
MVACTNPLVHKLHLDQGSGLHTHKPPYCAFNPTACCAFILSKGLDLYLTSPMCFRGAVLNYTQGQNLPLPFTLLITCFETMIKSLAMLGTTFLIAC